jgi:hypothetical protein
MRLRKPEDREFTLGTRRLGTAGNLKIEKTGNLKTKEFRDREG